MGQGYTSKKIIIPDATSTNKGIASFHVDSFNNSSGEIEKNMTACWAYRSSNQSINNATVTIITLNAEEYDIGGMHSNITNTERITVPYTGYYEVFGQVWFQTNGTGSRYVYIYHSSGGRIGIKSSAPTSTNEASPKAHAIWLCTASTYFYMRCYQNSGGALNASGASGEHDLTYLSVRYLGPANNN